jgi:hypothetical protein
MVGTINGATITVGNGSLTDTSGNVYTIVALGGGLTSVYENGGAIVGGDGGDVAGSIVEAEYVNGGIYLKYPSGHWYSFSNATGWSNSPVPLPATTTNPAPPVVTPPPPSSGTSSPDGMTIGVGSGSIVDSNGNIYTIAALGGGLTVVLENGVPISGGVGTGVAGSIIAAEFAGGVIYLQYPSGHWYTFNNSTGWSSQIVPAPVIATAAPPPVAIPPSTLSPNGTVITVGSGTITDAVGNVYTIVSIGNGLTSVHENGSAINGGDGTSVAASIIQAEFINGVLYLQYPSGHIYSFSNSAGWSESPVPLPPLSVESNPPIPAPVVVPPSIVIPPVAGPPPVVTPPLTGPLTLLHAEGTTFVDGNGNTVYLAGTHTWNDAQTYANEPQFTFQQFSDFEKDSVDANFIRYWLRPQVSNGDSTFPDSQLPFVRAADGKWDLTQFNQGFFEQLATNIGIAAQNGQYVDVQLLSGIGDFGTDDPFTAANNVQGVGNGTPGDSALQQYEQAYVAKILQTIGNAPNVIYEVANETADVGWQESIVNFVHSYEQQQGLLPQMVGITAPGAFSASPETINPELAASNADWISPSGTFFQNNPTPPVNKPTIVDDDHTGGVTDPGWAWKLLTTGNSVAYMDDMAGSGLTDPVYAGGLDAVPGTSYNGGDADIRDAIRLGIAETRQVAANLDLTGMTPQGDLSSTGYALADPTKGEYVVYAPSGGSFSVDLSGSSGSLHAAWVNVASAATTNAGTVQGGGSLTFTAPDAQDGLVLKS